jgi:mRNA interferase HicA
MLPHLYCDRCTTAGLLGREGNCFRKGIAAVIKNVYTRSVKSSEFKRWLAKQGVAFGTQKGSHLKLFLNGRQSILPMHDKELGKGLVETVKKQLGLKD